MIYLDVCCLNRPFDDQTQERIRLESEAVLSILSGCGAGRWYLVGSEVIDYEVSVTPDPERKEKVSAFANLAHERIEVDEGAKKRADYLVSLGFKPFDALHLACAESVVAEVLLTTDDKFLSKAKRNKNKLRVRVENPVIWFLEVIQIADSNDES